MSRDGLIPSLFSKVHPRFKTPHFNTLIVGFIVALAAGLTPIRVLGDMVSLGTLSAFMMVCFSVLYLRRKEPGLHRPFRTPGMPWVPVLGILSSMYLVSEMPKVTFDRLSYWMGAGLLFYLFFGQFNSVLYREGKRTLTGARIPAASGMLLDDEMGSKKKKASKNKGKTKARRR
jgi:APA family basic amino acid/polyamine antiporter